MHRSDCHQSQPNILHFLPSATLTLQLTRTARRYFGLVQPSAFSFQALFHAALKCLWCAWDQFAVIHGSECATQSKKVWSFVCRDALITPRIVIVHDQLAGNANIRRLPHGQGRREIVTFCLHLLHHLELHHSLGGC